MNIIIGCEYSGIVREAFAMRGHNAWSCDIVDTEIPGKHIKDDLRKQLNEGWDMMICFPPCTHLAGSGARWFKHKEQEQKEALQFVEDLLEAPIECIGLENPVGIISTRIRKPDQIIQPYMFGDTYSKKTCLWLKNLPLLLPTEIVSKGEFVVHGGKRLPKWYSNRERERDKTFPGIAKAMAEQWG